MAHTRKSHVNETHVKIKKFSLTHKRKRKNKNEFGMNAEKLLNNVGAKRESPMEAINFRLNVRLIYKEKNFKCTF